MLELVAEKDTRVSTAVLVGADSVGASPLSSVQAPPAGLPISVASEPAATVWSTPASAVAAVTAPTVAMEIQS